LLFHDNKMLLPNSIIDTIYNNYLIPFAYHANVTVQNNKLIAPLVKEVSVNTILFLSVIVTFSIPFFYGVKSILVSIYII
jgi:hypothetical protein